MLIPDILNAGSLCEKVLKFRRRLSGICYSFFKVTMDYGLCGKECGCPGECFRHYLKKKNGLLRI
jgi:hypothetical protein